MNRESFNTIQRVMSEITNIIKQDTCEDYSNDCLEALKKGRQVHDDYEEFLLEYFDCTPSMSLQEREESAKKTFSITYRDAEKRVKGFEANGKQYYLDRKTLVIFAIWDKNERGCAGMVNFNPFEYFIPDEVIKSDEMFKRIESNRYNVSTDEDALIEEVWNLIKAGNENLTNN